MKTLIFADVHLDVGSSGKRTLREFVAFLRQIDPGEYDRTIILGDLFDFWFEYRHVVFSGYFEVLRAFADLNAQGMSIHLVCGNHDFWAGRFLREELGFTIHKDRYTTELGDRRAVFVHGDGTNPSDYGYRLFKRVAQAVIPIKLFGFIHPDWAMAIARSVSHSSRKRRTPDDPSTSPEVEAMRAFAKGILESGEADMVFCGHTHFPVQEEIDTPTGVGLYVNTGAWFRQRTFLEWDGASLSRKYFVDGRVSTEAPDSKDWQ